MTKKAQKETLGQRIKQAREAAGLTQTAEAEDEGGLTSANFSCNWPRSTKED